MIKKIAKWCQRLMCRNTKLHYVQGRVGLGLCNVACFTIRKNCETSNTIHEISTFLRKCSKPWFWPKKGEIRNIGVLTPKTGFFMVLAKLAKTVKMLKNRVLGSKLPYQRLINLPFAQKENGQRRPWRGFFDSIFARKPPILGFSVFEGFYVSEAKTRNSWNFMKFDPNMWNSWFTKFWSFRHVLNKFWKLQKNVMTTSPTWKFHIERCIKNLTTCGSFFSTTKSLKKTPWWSNAHPTLHVVQLHLNANALFGFSVLGCSACRARTTEAS